MLLANPSMQWDSLVAEVERLKKKAKKAHKERDALRVEVRCVLAS